MDIMKELLNRINIYNDKIENEENLATKIAYIDELKRLLQIIKEIYQMEINSLLNANK